jgi:hypothetical protein
MIQNEVDVRQELLNHNSFSPEFGGIFFQFIDKEELHHLETVHRIPAEDAITMREIIQQNVVGIVFEQVTKEGTNPRLVTLSDQKNLQVEIFSKNLHPSHYFLFDQANGEKMRLTPQNLFDWLSSEAPRILFIKDKDSEDNDIILTLEDFIALYGARLNGSNEIYSTSALETALLEIATYIYPFNLYRLVEQWDRAIRLCERYPEIMPRAGVDQINPYNSQGLATPDPFYTNPTNIGPQGAILWSARDVQKERPPFNKHQTYEGYIKGWQATRSFRGSFEPESQINWLMDAAKFLSRVAEHNDQLEQNPALLPNFYRAYYYEVLAGLLEKQTNGYPNPYRLISLANATLAREQIIRPEITKYGRDLSEIFNTFNLQGGYDLLLEALEIPPSDAPRYIDLFLHRLTYKGNRNKNHISNLLTYPPGHHMTDAYKRFSSISRYLNLSEERDSNPLLPSILLLVNSAATFNLVGDRDGFMSVRERAIEDKNGWVAVKVAEAIKRQKTLVPRYPDVPLDFGSWGREL